MKNKQKFYYFEPIFINKRSFWSPWGKRIMKVNGKYYRLKKKKIFFSKFECSTNLVPFFIISQQRARVLRENLLYLIGFYTNFTCSRAWIDRWKDQKNIEFEKIDGEEKSADTSEFYCWLENVWPISKANYCDDVIFNVVETLESRYNRVSL